MEIGRFQFGGDRRNPSPISLSVWNIRQLMLSITSVDFLHCILRSKLSPFFLTPTFIILGLQGENEELKWSRHAVFFSNESFNKPTLIKDLIKLVFLLNMILYAQENKQIDRQTDKFDKGFPKGYLTCKGNEGNLCSFIVSFIILYVSPCFLCICIHSR